MLEIVVRPYQTPSVFNRGSSIPKIISTSGGPPVNAVLEWGDAGTVPAGIQQPVDATESGGFKVDCCNDSFNEKNKKTTDINVTNPDDISQSVTVRRIDSIKFQFDWSECDSGQNKNGNITVGTVDGLFTATGNPVMQATASGSTNKNCDQDYVLDWKLAGP